MQKIKKIVISFILIVVLALNNPVYADFGDLNHMIAGTVAVVGIVTGTVIGIVVAVGMMIGEVVLVEEMFIFLVEALVVYL